MQEFSFDTDDFSVIGQKKFSVGVGEGLVDVDQFGVGVNNLPA